MPRFLIRSTCDDSNLYVCCRVSAAMYDFCMTFPYAALLALGGLMGFLVKGSVPSLMGGLGSALILAIAGQRSISYYHQVQSCACIDLQIRNKGRVPSGRSR